ncbi:MAG: hypothetical protein JW818_13660 [Pirellulales bacterium]|nr:hypothetical protein [Pirellulales bacterium]
MVDMKKYGRFSGIHNTALGIAGVLVALATWPCPTVQAAGDHQWNYEENYDDRFHDNQPWLRPWDGSDSTAGRWVGNWTYRVPWHNKIEGGNADGSLSFGGPRDRQFHAWTFVYVDSPTTISISGGGDCVPRWFLNYAFDSPYGFPINVTLQEGWNRIDVTGYNQNDSWTFSMGPLAGQVDIMDHEETTPPDANFSWNPNAGWAGTTLFDFEDQSTATADKWSWDVDGDDVVDYMSQNVTGHTYAAPDGGSAIYDVSLKVGVTEFGNILDDEETKDGIITVYGKPIADFTYARNDLTVDFTDISIKPGYAELGEYSFAWDMDNDGFFDDAFDANPQWTFAAANTYQVSLMVSNGAGYSVMAHDVYVPEPSLVVLLIGMLGLPFLRRRRYFSRG